MKNRSLAKHLILLSILFSLILAACGGNKPAIPFDINSLEIHPAGGLVSHKKVNLYFSAVSERQREKFEKWLEYWFSSPKAPFKEDANFWWACVFNEPDEPAEIYRLLNVDGTLYTLPKDYQGSKVPPEEVYGKMIKPAYAPVEVISADEISRLSVKNGVLMLSDEETVFDVQERAWVTQLPTAIASTQVVQAPTLTPTPSSARKLIPAPLVPEVSGPITPENVSQIMRLTSLGEGDLLNLQFSPDGKYLVLGTSSGVLVLDADNLSKVLYLPTVMKAKNVAFSQNGEQLTAMDNEQGYAWTFPQGELLSHVVFRCIDPSQEGWMCFRVLNSDSGLEYAIGSQTGLMISSDEAVLNEALNFIRAYWQYPLSSDGQYLATYNPDRLKLINFQDGTIIKEVAESGTKVLLFFPDGNTLGEVTGSQLKLWSVPDMGLIDEVTVYSAENIRFSPDQSTFALISEGNVRVYRTEDRLLITALPGSMFTFSPDSQSLLIDGGEGYVHLYQFDLGRTRLDFLATFAGQGIRDQRLRPTQAGVFSADSQKVLLMKTTGVTYSDVLEQLLVYDVGSGSKVQVEFQPYQDYLGFQHAVWLPEQQAFALLMCKSFFYGGCYIGTIDAQTGTFTKYLEKDDSREESRKEIEFSRHSDLLVSATGNNTLFIWDIQNGGYFRMLGEPVDGFWEPYNTEIVFLHDDSIIRYLDTAGTNHQIASYDFKELDWVVGRFFNPGEGLEGWTEGSFVIIKDAQSWEDLLWLNVTNMDLDFNPARNQLATVTEEGVKVWDISTLSQPQLFFTGKVFERESPYSTYFGEVAFSPNGEFVAANYIENWPYYKVSIWHTQDGTLAHLLNGEGGSQFKNFTYSADSRMIVVSEHTMDGNDIGFYDLQSGEQLFRLSGLCKGDYPAEIAISPDGKYMGVLCSYGFPEIWGIP